MEEFYSKEQVRAILQMVRDRYAKDNKSFNVKVEGSGVTFSIYQPKHIYISINKDFKSIYVSLQEISSSYRIEDAKWPWSKDKENDEIKALCKELIERAKNQGKTSSEIITDVFPEFIHKTFEENVLEVKDGSES